MNKLSSKNKLKFLQESLNIPTQIEPVKLTWIPDQFELWIKRDDQIHPVISGNKWRKLKYQLEYVLDNNYQHIISFGGPRSNHLHALAFCCNQLNIKLSAIIRGKHHQYLSKTLLDMQKWQTKLHFVDNQTYQCRSDPDYLKTLNNHFSDAYIIPEGGTSPLSLKGVEEILDEAVDKEPKRFDYCFVPVGSGGTMAGLVSTNKIKNIEGICVLKGAEYLNDIVANLVADSDHAMWKIHHDFHCDGYAKAPLELIEFCADFIQQTGISIEPVYSGKLFFALKQLLQQNYFEHPCKILAIHTGGLQADCIN